MAVSFFIRSKKAEEATLFARMRSRSKKIDIKTSTLIDVNVSAWEKAQESTAALKRFRTANKEKIEKLDAIESTLNAMIDADNIEVTNDIVSKRIYEIVFAKQIQEEKERQEAEKRALEAKQAKTFDAYVAQYIEECESGKRLKKGKTTKIAPGTIKSYKGFASQLKAYEESRLVIVGFEDLTIDFYNDFRAFLIEKNYRPNTIARMVKICKTMCYAAEKLKLMDAKDVRAGFDVVRKEVDNVYLSMERIQELYDMDLSDRPAWEKVRDVFVVGCLTGQRVSDYKRVNSGMIVTLDDGRPYIELTQRKTGKNVYIPLDARVKNILDKREGSLPKVADQKINDYIKKIGEALGWTEIVKLDEQRGLMEYTASERFCDLLKTHTCRRSFATNMHKSGASLGSIMAITGHSSEQQLRTYLKLSDREKAMEAAKEMYFNPILRIAK